MNFARDPSLVLALCVVFAMVLAACLAPVIASGLFAQLFVGLRLTLLIGAAAVVIGGGVGAVIGLMAAFYRRLDFVLMRCTDVLLSFPAILSGLLLAAILGPGELAIVLALSLATLPLMARVARDAAAAEMACDYIVAARTIGMRDARLIWRHLVPNVLPALLAFATRRFGQVILLGSALSFLGLGAQPPVAELGAMAAEGKAFLFHAPLIALAPCFTIFLIVLAFNVLGDAFGERDRYE